VDRRAIANTLVTGLFFWIFFERGVTLKKGWAGDLNSVQPPILRSRFFANEPVESKKEKWDMLGGRGEPWMSE